MCNSSDSSTIAKAYFGWLVGLYQKPTIKRNSPVTRLNVTFVRENGASVARLSASAVIVLLCVGVLSGSTAEGKRMLAEWTEVAG